MHNLEERISIPELADELQCYKQSLFKIAKRLNISAVKKRDSERRNQLVATVSMEEALLIKQEFIARTRQSFNNDLSIENLIADNGLFYLIQLEPEHDPERVKVGFSTDLEGRLQKHRCSAPFAQYLKTWPCQRLWERTAIDSITNGAEKLHTEVFRVDSLAKVLERADNFFALMPLVLDVNDVAGDEGLDSEEPDYQNVLNQTTCPKE